MDYILTFEDGSDAYLSHHGVKGMKWGVRKERKAAIQNARLNKANSANEAYTNYVNEGNKIRTNRKMKAISRKEAGQQHRENALRYNKSITKAVNNKNIEMAKAKGIGKSTKTQNKYMRKAEVKNALNNYYLKGSEYALKQSTAKSLAKSYTMGAGTAPYNAARALGKSRTEAFFKGIYPEMKEVRAKAKNKYSE
jgi:hypothetical protein